MLVERNIRKEAGHLVAWKRHLGINCTRMFVKNARLDKEGCILEEDLVAAGGRFPFVVSSNTV